MSNQESWDVFRAAGENYHSAIEIASARPRADFLVDIAASLASVYAAAVRLPHIAPQTIMTPRAEQEQEQDDSVKVALERRLIDFSVYWDTFDPFDPDDREPVATQLALELAEIDSDLQAALAVSAPIQNLDDQIFSAKMDFEIHWSHHAAGALRAITALMYRHGFGAVGEGSMPTTDGVATDRGL